jgi:hypothetical protein
MKSKKEKNLLLGRITTFKPFGDSAIQVKSFKNAKNPI